MTQYLGIDSSTQSLSATIIDTEAGAVIAEASINFGEALSKYQSPSGFLPNADATVKQSNPLMWVEALDLLFADLRERGADLSRVRGVSGAGQQHGSVYLARALASVGKWDPGKSLVDQVRPLLSRPVSPIWMDSSTTAECRELAAALGSDEQMVKVTGSRAIERFTAAQIRKFAKQEPAAWARTQEVHLVSSFLASLLIADTAPIDLGDGAGMNLLDLASGRWSPELLEATADGLRGKLADPVPSTSRVGTLAQYFIDRFGFSAGTPVIAFTGDNPSSLVGMGATQPGTAVISLGTSDTVFAAMSEPRTDPNGFGHVFGNPAGGFMSLICFANGSLAREAVARQFSLDWEQFERAIIEETTPGNGGNMMLPYFVPEMTPRICAAGPRYFGTSAFVEQKDARGAARAIVEAQAVSMRLFSGWIGEAPTRILVTGGASKNRGILRVLADVFQAEIVPLVVSNSAALGAAVRAAQATEGVSFEQLASTFSAPDEARSVAPSSATRGVYEDMAASFEARLNALRAVETGS